MCRHIAIPMTCADTWLYLSTWSFAGDSLGTKATSPYSHASSTYSDATSSYSDDSSPCTCARAWVRMCERTRGEQVERERENERERARERWHCCVPTSFALSLWHTQPPECAYSLCALIQSTHILCPACVCAHVCERVHVYVCVCCVGS